LRIRPIIHNRPSLKKIIVTAVFAIALLLPCFAQKSDKLELTQTDIISAGKLDGAAISVFGFYLGMKKAEARNILQHNTNKITVDYNSWNIVNRPISDTIENGCYVYAVDSLTGQQKNCILFLGWNNKDPGLARITVFSEFKEYVKGLTWQLFTSDVANPKSAFYKKWLIRPTTGSPGISTSSWFYQASNIMIITNSATGEAKYYFMLTKKAVF